MPASVTRAQLSPASRRLQHRLAAGPGVVAVVGDHGLFQPQVVEQLQGHPGVLGGDEVRLRQGLRHPPGDVPQVADGGGYQIDVEGPAMYITFPVSR